MSSYVKYHDEVLNNNPELKVEYDALAPEYDIIQAMIDEGQEESCVPGAAEAV